MSCMSSLTKPHRGLRAAIVGVVAVAGSLSMVSSAAADGRAATCRKLRAEARSQAALLYAPRLTASVVHLPSGTAADVTSISLGDGNQVRGAIALSPVDMWRGHLVLRAADAECRRVAAADRLEPVLREGVSYGRAPALRAQIDFLTGALPRVDELVAEAQARLDCHILTASDVDRLRSRRDELRRQLVESRHALAVLQAEDPARDPATPAVTTGAELAGSLTDYERATLTAERTRSSLRRVSPWQVDLRVGVVPTDQPSWFGVVQVSYSLGDLWQRSAERAYLDARADELRESDDELRLRTARFTRAMTRSVAGLRRELALIDQERSRLADERRALAGLDGDRAHQRRVLAELDGIVLGARRTYLARLVAARAVLAHPGARAR